MSTVTTYRVRALGTLWTGHVTWDTRTLDAAPHHHVTRGPLVPSNFGQGVESVFPDFATITDYEVVRYTLDIRVIATTQTPTRTITVTETTATEEVTRAWSDPDSAERWEDLECGAVSPSEEAAVSAHEHREGCGPPEPSTHLDSAGEWRTGDNSEDGE